MQRLKRASVQAKCGNRIRMSIAPTSIARIKPVSTASRASAEHRAQSDSGGDSVNFSTLNTTAISRFERFVVTILQWLLILVIVIALIELGAVIFRVIATALAGDASSLLLRMDSIAELQHSVQRTFAGVLLIILGLELLDTLKVYFTEHRLRLEVILIVAIIAVGRHIIQLDLERLEATVLLGIGVLVVALTAGYFLIKRASMSA
jgi:uncharacterized membrane protein (DUF373 family)